MKLQKNIAGITLLSVACTATLLAQKNQVKKMNIVIIVADDLNSSTTSLFGSKVENITPNLEKLASQGVLFRHAHVAASVSQVSRGALMTGKYPHNNGIDGFYHTTLDIPTFQEVLQDNNYRIGILGKNSHSTPKKSIKWDLNLDALNAGSGRNPELYYQLITNFIKESKNQNRPYFFMANSHDPHRPFSGSDQEKIKFPNHPFPLPSRIYTESEIEIPGFLPDIPLVRKEICEYYNSVKRLDDMVGAVLKAIEDSGTENETMVVFLSDNGMALPFAKTNCYLHSTHTPLIMKIPGVTKAGSENKDMVNVGIDFMPTALEAAKIKIPKGLDGSSLVPVLKGQSKRSSQHIITEFCETSGKNRFPMRAIQDQTYGYIFNAWSDGKIIFKNESQSGRTFPAMVANATSNPMTAERVEFFKKRVLEEFYDFSKDPDALNNLIDNPQYKNEIDKMRKLLEKHFIETNDPILGFFRNRYDKKAQSEFIREQNKIIQERLAKSPLKKGSKQNATNTEDDE